MRAIVQRVKYSSVEFYKDEEKIINEISAGLQVLVGITQDDTQKDVEYIVDKITGLRIFEDENDVMNRSLLDINGNILSISQFTLYGDASKGRRPSYIKALGGDKATLLYDEFNNRSYIEIDESNYLIDRDTLENVKGVIRIQENLNQ